MRNWWTKTWTRPQRTRTGLNKPLRGWRFPILGAELLEDRTVPSAFTELAATLNPVTGSPLIGVQSSLTNVLNTASRVPLLTQNGGGTLGNFNELQLITPVVVSRLHTALNDPANDTPEKMEMTAAVATAFGVTAGDVAISDPGGPDTVEIRVNFHKTAASGTLPAGAGLKLDLGLPGLPVGISATTAGSINTDLTYSYPFEFGFDPARGGLYVDPTQFAVIAKVAPSPDFVASATLGLLQANLRPTPQSNGLTATVQVNGLALGGTPTYALTGGVDLDLRAEASFAATADNSFKFPGISTDLNILWNLPDGAPAVTFEQVSFNLGTFLSQFVNPIVQNIQTFTRPLQPLFDVLTTPLPGLSDLSHLIGQGDVDLLGIAKVAGTVAGGSTIGQAIKLIDTIATVGGAVNSLNASSGNLGVPLGSFSLDASVAPTLRNGTLTNLGGGATRSDPALLGAIRGSGAIQGIEDAISKIGLSTDQARNALRMLGLTEDGIRLSFPILTDPQSVIFPLLLGHEGGDLVSLDVNFTFTAASNGVSPNLSVYGLGIRPTGSIKATANVHLGYDTAGLLTFFRDADPADPSSGDPADLLDGFYIRNNPPGQDHFTLGGAIQLEAGFSAGLFGASVGGGVFTGGNPLTATDNPIRLNLHDPTPDDGKLRFGEIDPNCIFRASGVFSGGIGVNVRVGVHTPLGFVGFTKTFVIASTALLDFGAGRCLGQNGTAAAPPVLASVDASGTMTLFLGTRAGQRQNVSDRTDDDPETWTITHESGDPVDTLTVRALGVTQKLAGVRRIVATGGAAALSITVQDGVLADADLAGGQAADNLVYLGGGTARLSGGGNNDRLALGPNSRDSELRGGGGDDLLIGGAGRDRLFGEGDHDTLFAGTGDQELRGGEGNDQLTAGPGRSALFGEGGDDTLYWLAGNGAPTALDGGAGSRNILEIKGGGGADSFAASAAGAGLSLLANGVAFGAVGIQELHLDGTGGADAATVNDLTGTGVSRVYVNQGQATDLDGAADAVTIDARGGTNLLINQAVGEVKTGVRGAQALINGLPYRVFVANLEAHDSLTVNAAADSTVTVDPLDAVNPFDFAAAPDPIPLPGRITVNGGAGTNTFNVRSATGVTSINVQGGRNTFNVGSNPPTTLVNIKAPVFLNGSGGSDAARVNGSGDTADRTGTLTASQVTGLGMSAGITYSSLEAITVALGSGNDTFTISGTSAGTTTVTAGAGSDSVTVQSASGAVAVHGGEGNDTLTADTLPTLQTQRDRPNDGVGVVRDTVDLDGQAGGDSYIVNVTGAGDYVVNARDTGADAGTDTLTVNGTGQADTFLLRAGTNAGGIAFAAAVHGDPASTVERVNYDRALEGLVLETHGGDDRATLDDNWAPTTIRGGSGRDHFQVGQIFKTRRDANAGVAPADEFATVESTRGFLSNGVSFPTRIEGGSDNDEFVVFRNKAPVSLLGDAGDDTITVRSFAAEEGSKTTRVEGGANVDVIEYVANAPVEVDGGDGFDTLRVIGTEFADKYVITAAGVFGGGRQSSYVNIEKLEVDGAEGDDEFYVLSTDSKLHTSLFGGLGSDRFSLAGDTVAVDAGTGPTRPAEVGSHRLNLIQGPLHIDGAAGEGSAGGLGKPVMLPGETNLLPVDGKVLAYTGTGASLATDTMTVLTADLEAARVREGLASLGGLVGKTLEVSRGNGLDRFWLITGVAVGPTTTVLSLRNVGMPAPEWELPDVGSSFTVTHLSPNFFVSEADTLDSAAAFDDGSTAGDAGALSGTALTGLGMSAAGVTYANLETLEVLLGTGNDAFTVTGTAAGTITAVHGGGGSDRIIVTGGGGPAAPLLVHGDTTHDRSRYTADGVTPRPGFGFSFGADGADVIDASAATQGVAIYGGGQNDLIHGSQAGDHIGGGSGNDEIHGQGGADHVYGDSGFNQDLSQRLDRATNQILTVVTVETAGSDTIFGGGGTDIAFGDHGIITQTDGTQRILSTGNVTGVATTNFGNGGDDTAHGGADADLVLGGLGHDRLDGDAGDDLVLGDHATLAGRTPGVTTSPRYRTLTGSQLYDDSGNPQVGADWQSAPGAAPWWANSALTLGDGLSGYFGNDYLAGGANNDMVFGQAGDDVIQGDGSIELNVGTVAAPGRSAEDHAGAGSDGDDYLEGNSGSDLIFGNLGQDDIVGGSSDLFGLTAVGQRGDGADTIFGGAGTRTGANDPGDTSLAGHARDADLVLGDNGNIFRVLGPTGAYLTFNYDTYGPLRIVPRVVRMLDYTPGGAATDVGGHDLIQGEAGDDILHGMAGNDVLFGQGQDDDLYGEAGHDRIYGGTGEDGVLGDDGVIRTSRNGLTEPLHALTTPNVQTNISLPGPFTGAWIYITGRLEKNPDLLAWDRGGNDVIYGGLGDDFLHGGAGDDGISGAEAQAAFYHTNPVSDTNPLRYDPATRKLAAYDADNPLVRISGFFLNFDAVDAAGGKIEDGKDRLFGDLGHDWLVGGTQNDRLFGGKGDDLHNADDNHDTAGGLNNRPDEVLFADRDFVYGGDGLDVLIANTGGDRMFDWGGEFNTYVVPFSPFGNPTVVRSPSPHVQAFLLALGRESGADQSLAEPDGELGLFDQHDPEWQQNHGGPRDPQAGNTPGTRRDTQGAPEDDRGTALPLSVAGAAARSSAPAANSTDATVDAVLITADPSDPTRLALFVGGTDAADAIEIRQGAAAGTVEVVVNGVSRGVFPTAIDGRSLGRIMVWGHGGDDTITIHANVGAVDAVLYGGDGRDTLRAGSGNTILDGGTGDDTLLGGTGRDILIGGAGADELRGSRAGDVLIGGTYGFSEDLDALAEILGAWTTSQSYDDRVAALRALPHGLNTQTVSDDGVADRMYGEYDRDWFLGTAVDWFDQRGSEDDN